MPRHRGRQQANAAALIQNAFTGANSQKWKILQVSAGKYKVVNVNSGLGLDVPNGTTTSGVWVQQYHFNGTANQLWSFSPTGTGYYKFSPASNVNGSLNVRGSSWADGTAIEQWAWNTSSTGEQWNITPTN